MNAANAQVLDQVVLVQLDIRASDLASKVVRERDLKNATAAMPPSSLISSGVKHYADPKLKNPFNKLKKRAERECFEVGFQLLKGWAVPKDKALELSKKLNAIGQEYRTEADLLAAALPNEFVRWEQANPGWEHLWADRPTPGEIRGRYLFRHCMYRMRPAGDADDELASETGVTSGSLLEAILDDVAATATEILAKSFEGKATASCRVIPSIAAIGAKLKGFAMIDPLVLPVASMIGDVVAGIGAPTQQLSVTHSSALRGLLEMLTSPAKVRVHGAAALNLKPETVDEETKAVTVVEGVQTTQSVTESVPDQVVMFPESVTNPEPGVVVPPPPVAVAPVASTFLF